MTGNGFVPGSVVKWNGTTLTTTFVSANQVMAAASASLLGSSGNASIVVVSASGASSGTAVFAIN